MNVTSILTKDYENETAFALRQNKPNSNPIKPTGFCSNFPFNRPAMSERSESNGGGGIRTPVPRCFKTSFYMHSRFIIFFASLSAKRQAQKLAISVFLAGVGPNNRLGQSAI